MSNANPRQGLLSVVWSTELFRTVCIFAALMCLLALLPLPMLSFQSLSRYVVLLAAAWGAVASFFAHKLVPGLLFIAVAAALNPFVLLLPTLASVRVVSIAAAALFLYGSVQIDPRHIGDSRVGDELAHDGRLHGDQHL